MSESHQSKLIRWRSARLLSGFVVLSIGLLSTAFAQDDSGLLDRAVEDVSPGFDRRPSGVVEDQREDEEFDIEAHDDTPLGVNVAALRLIAHQNQVESSAWPGEQLIRFHPELETPEDLEALLQPYLGRPISMRLLAELSREIILAWRASDYPLVDVYYPEQNITEGKLQVVVREAVLGQKSVEHSELSKPQYLTGQLQVEPGDRVNRRQIEADLDWLNEHPARRVDLIYERGEKDGSTDIILIAEEEDAFQAYTGIADTGLELTGREEWSAGFTWSNPWQTEQVIGYHYGSDVDFDSIHSHALVYQNFLPWRHILRVTGAHVTSDGESELIPGIPVGIDGVSSQVSLDYRIPLPRMERFRSYRHYLTFGFDWKQTNSDLELGGSTLFGSEIEVGQFRLEYEGSFPDPLGYTFFRLGWVGSPGDLFGANNDVAFQQARAGTSASYQYFFAEAEKTVDLPNDWLLVGRARFQATGDRLVSTEQLFAGGYRSVRGFDENVVRADQGAVVSVEFRSAPFELLNRVAPESPLEETWRGLAFFDAAALRINDATGTESSASLASVGLGVEGKVADHLVARLAYGWVIADNDVAGDLDSGRWHFGVTWFY
ncbi:MAG: ShlB/FhaC/HecB family hemolysin secretion/activation protein [Verrucomicrobiota bacterium]